MRPLDLLAAAYEPLVGVAEGLDDDAGWVATELPGWTVRDLVFHLLSDAQRALVALGTPSDSPADTDEVGYWAAWSQGEAEARTDLRNTRIMASCWGSVTPLAASYAATARAVLTLAAQTHPEEVVVTQGHRIQVGALLSTLAVEATVHHLDLGERADTAPSEAGLAETCRVLDALLGGTVEVGWSPARQALVGTGRREPSEAERTALGARAARLPLFA